MNINLTIKGCPKLKLGKQKHIPPIGSKIHVLDETDKTKIFEVKELQFYYRWHLHPEDKWKDAYEIDNVQVEVEQIYG